MTEKITKSEMIGLRISSDLFKKLEIICKTENKKPASVAADACMVYAELYPSIHLLKSLKLNPQITVNEEEIKKKMYDTIKKLI